MALGTTVFVLLGPAVLAQSQHNGSLPLTIPGPLDSTSEGSTGAGEFSLPLNVRRALSDLGSGSLASRESRESSGGDGASPSTSLEILDFPVEPGVRESVSLEPVVLWAPNAGVHVVEDTRITSVPPSGRRFYRGTSASGTRLALNLDGDQLFGHVFRPQGHFVIAPDARNRDLYTIEREDFGDRTFVDTCGNEISGDPMPVARAEGLEVNATDTFVKQLAADLDGLVALGAAATGGLRQAVVAIDTDTTFMASKGNSTVAIAYIEDLFLVLNTIYERDVGMRLLIGDTFLRPTSDPYTNTNSPASSAGLYQFRDYWMANYSGIPRAFAMLLSGNSSASTSASGIASVNAYCDSARSYSVNQIFTGNFGVALDARIVAHELGHNAGSEHTHCYSPPVDTCYSSSSACYSGPTSCPAAGSGTMMSYCSSGACGLGVQNRLEFHPTVANNIISKMNAQPTCLVPVGSNGSLFGDGFESGSLGAWN